jgi:hypothetical protein
MVVKLFPGTTPRRWHGCSSNQRRNNAAYRKRTTERRALM